MNELQLTRFDNTDITTWDFQALKAELQAYLSEYEGLVYTDETIKQAKLDRTTLNKAKKVLEDARKAYKVRCMEPYNAIESQVKELTGLLDERKRQIDDTVKDYEARKKAEKEQKVREYYDRASYGLGQYREPLYEKLFNPKWTNATMSVAQYREEIQTAVASAKRDLDSIRDMQSPFYETLKDVYVQTLSMDAVLRKNEELKEAADKAGLTEAAAAYPAAPVTNEPVEKAKDEEDAAVIKIYASEAKVNQICDFMKAIGVRYEIM